MSLSNQRIITIGTSRGLGRGVALALAAEGARVLAISRTDPQLENIESRLGDATDPSFVANVCALEDADAVVLVAGAQPAMQPLSQYDWEAFSRCWECDVKATFHWVKAALTRPARGRFIIFSSGAALHGSPLSGGYAGAKNTQRFIAKYAQAEATQRGLDLKFHTVLPQLNPNTELGAAGVKAYAAAAGEEPAAFVEKRFGDPVNAEKAGAAVVRWLTDPELAEVAECMLSGKGLHPLDA
jgi:NAD(P)-dependent dehydrogenase (short-subunit alcohol dehydrogenase family)